MKSTSSLQVKTVLVYEDPDRGRTAPWTAHLVEHDWAICGDTMEDALEALRADLEGLLDYEEETGKDLLTGRPAAAEEIYAAKQQGYEAVARGRDRLERLNERLARRETPWQCRVVIATRRLRPEAVAAMERALRGPGPQDGGGAVVPITRRSST